MTSWDSYLDTFLESYRDLTKRMSIEQQRILQTMPSVSFSPPCQIEVLEFIPLDRTVWVLLYDKKRKDKEFTSSKDTLQDVTHLVDNIVMKYPWLRKKRDLLTKRIQDGLQKPYDQFKRVTPQCGTIAFTYNVMDSFPDPAAHATMMMLWTKSFVRNKLEREKLKNTTRTLKDQIDKVPQAEIRTELQKTVSRLDEHQTKLSKITSDILGVRKLIGATKEFQDWKLLVSDVNDLKKTHIPKELFMSEVKRLDQRIDALREIKFMSKRTILDIILAIIAATSTIIAALLATGIINI